jgi:hypothetical protein
MRDSAREQMNHIVRNGIGVVRHMLKQANCQLDGMEKDLAQIESPLKKNPHLRLRVVRLEDHNEGSLGVLIFDERLFCFTLEPDSKDPAKPPIPAGTYPLKHFSGYKHKNTLEVVVPGHTAVLFHSGNIEADSEMCVLIARDPGYLYINEKRIRAILDSRSVYRKFQQEIVAAVSEGDKVEFLNCYS